MFRISRIILRGFAYGALPIAMQGWMLKAALDEMEGASAMFISMLQVGPASSAFLAGVVVDHFGLGDRLGMRGLGRRPLVWIFGGEGVAYREAAAR